MATATRPGLQATELSFCLPPSGLGPLSPWVAVAVGGGVSEGAGALGGCGTPCGLSSLWFQDQESPSRPATSRKQKEKAVPGASDLKQANKQVGTEKECSECGRSPPRHRTRATPRLPAAPGGGEGRPKAVTKAAEFWVQTSSSPRLSCQGRLGVRAGSPSRFELSPVEGPGDQSFAGDITAELAGHRRRLAFRRLRRRLLHNVWK